VAEQRTQFDYLLNAVLHAGQADKPAEHGYRDKMLALFAYVRQLEAVVQQGEGPSWDPVTDVNRLIADGFARHGYRQGTKECIAFFRGAGYALERIAAGAKEVPDANA
jgi:hypothetical protein